MNTVAHGSAHGSASALTPSAPPRRGGRRDGATPSARSAQRSLVNALVDELVAERVARRERGEVPPLPDPLARRRGGRLARMACGIELQQRELDGTISDVEQQWLRLRREHLAEWQQQRAQRFAIRAAKAASAPRVAVVVDDSRATPDPGARPPRSLRAVTTDQWRGRLKGPNDLRALVARVRGLPDDL